MQEKLQKTSGLVGLMPLALAMSGLFVAAAAQAEGVELHGYVRTQVGGTSEGGNLQCFGGDGTWPIRSKYRLGNECDNFASTTAIIPFGKSDGAWAKYHQTLSFKEKGKQAWESTDDKTLNIASEQAFIEAGGFFDGGALDAAKVWVGKRFYNRHDIHMSDYYYWGNNGMGAGIEEINAGPGKVSLAYFQNGGNANGVDDIVGKRYSARFYDIDVNPNGKLEAELVLLNGSTASADATKETGNGTMLFLQHTQSGVLGGWNKFGIVYGSKLGSGFEWLPTYQGGGVAKGHSWRIHDHLYFAPAGTKITGVVTASYGKANFGGPNSNTFMSVGIRPQYNYSDLHSTVLEIGYDAGKTDGGNKPKVAKVTLAQQLTLSTGFWARPVFRAFVTHAKWNDAAGTQANGVFGTKKTGTTFGAQAEVWW
jgi:maltoporin